jgi:Zn-finger nucleic acid-binding protein
MKCCGEDRETIYCPECGALLIKDSVEQIVKYLRGKLSSYQAIQRRAKVWDDEHPNRKFEYYRVRKRKSLQNKIEKFERWIKCLEEKEQS